MLPPWTLIIQVGGSLCILELCCNKLCLYQYSIFISCNRISDKLFRQKMWINISPHFFHTWNLKNLCFYAIPKGKNSRSNRVCSYNKIPDTYFQTHACRHIKAPPGLLTASQEFLKFYLFFFWSSPNNETGEKGDSCQHSHIVIQNNVIGCWFSKGFLLWKSNKPSFLFCCFMI